MDTRYVSKACITFSCFFVTFKFSKWVNKYLLLNSTLEPGFPRSISVETARKWLHELGFEVLTAKKGVFVDGHERPDVGVERYKNDEAEKQGIWNNGVRFHRRARWIFGV